MSKQDRRMFFVLGNPRSGTSLIRIMMTNHPMISIPPECGFIQWWEKKYRNWSIKDSLNEDRVNEFIKDLATSRKIETWDMDFGKLSENILMHKPGSYSSLCTNVLESYAIQKNKKPVLLGDKNNYYLDHLELMNSLFGDAKYISIIRDGRDVACSYRAIKSIDTQSPYKPILPFEIDEIAKEWKSNIEKTERFFSSLNVQSYLWVKYEDLISAPEKTLKHISQFLEIEYDAGMLMYNKKKAEEPQQLLDWKKKTLEKPDSRNQKKYLELLTQDQSELFVELANDVLTRYGYL